MLRLFEYGLLKTFEYLGGIYHFMGYVKLMAFCGLVNTNGFDLNAYVTAVKYGIRCSSRNAYSSRR